MIKAIFIILTLAGFASSAEFEVTDKLSVVSTAVFSGSVGIGTSAPSSSLEVKGNITANGMFRGTHTVLDDSMLDNFTLKLDTTTNKITLADRIEQNIMLDAFKIAVSSSLSTFNMVDGIMDEFEDEIGVDKIDSSSQTYNSAGRYYSPLVGIGGLDSNTKLMVHFNSMINGSKEIQDSGYTGYVVTCVNGANISTTQAKIGLSSLSLNGSNQYLTVPDSDDWDFGAGNFTVDWWEYRTVNTASHCSIVRDATTNFTPFIFGHSDGTDLHVYVTSNGSSWDIASAKTLGAISLNTWVHLAVVRNGSTWYCFKNGTQTDTWNSSAIIAANSNPLSIGCALTPPGYFQGYIDELRISKGIARWTSNFTSPTSAYISDANTQLLLHMESLDTSSTTAPKIPTFVGTAHLDTAQKEFGTASLFFNGSSDYVTVPDSDDWTFGTDAATIDFWVKFNNTTGSQFLVVQSANNGANIWYCAKETDLTLQFRCYTVSGTERGYYYMTNAWTGLANNIWYHLAFVKTASTAYIFIDGVSQILTQGVAMGNWTDISGLLYIGQQGNNSTYLNGYIDELRISKGIARWTTNFTRPTNEYSTITATYNMTLVSTTTLAVSTPSSARIVLFEEDVDTVTLNSELEAYVTGKDTTSWTQVTLADDGYYQSGKRILSGMAGIMAASIGTAMRWKVETHNNRNLKLHGVGLSWD